MPFNHPPFTALFSWFEKINPPETTQLSSISTLYHNNRIISREFSYIFYYSCPDFFKLQSLHSICKFSGTVLPPACQGVI